MIQDVTFLLCKAIQLGTGKLRSFYDSTVSQVKAFVICTGIELNWFHGSSFKGFSIVSPPP